MKSINLLPKSRQVEIHLEDRFKHVLIFFTISLGTLILSTLAIAGARLYLNTASSSISRDIDQLKNAVNKQENAELKTKIAGINNQIVDFKTLAETTPAWSKVLLSFGKLVPEGVGITSFNAEIEKGKIEINGFAKSRSSVIELYNNIKADTVHFKDINYPLENVATPNDVNFRFTFYMKPETLKP